MKNELYLQPRPGTGNRSLNRQEVLRIAERENIRFPRLQFSDILGTSKNVEVPRGQFEKALDGEIAFDGSSIEGFVRIEESDMLLRPDLSSFTVFPWEEAEGRVARVICDVTLPDGSDFPGCPRTVLRRVTQRAAWREYSATVHPWELERYLARY